MVSQFATHNMTREPISRQLHQALLHETHGFWALDAEHTLFLAALDQHFHSKEFMVRWGASEREEQEQGETDKRLFACVRACMIVCL